MCDRPSGEAEISLRLAAAGRKEEQIDGLAIGVQRIVQTRKIQEDEGELERPPLRSCLAGWITAVTRRALAIGARHRLIHGAEGETRVWIARKKRDAVRDSSACVARGVDEALRGGLPRRAGNAGDRGGLCRDPGIVCRRQAFECAPQIVRSCPRQLGERLHLEYDVRDILVRLNPFDFSSRQVVGCSLSHDPVRISLPVRGRVYAHREFADIPVMQVCDGLVDILRAEAAHIRARMKTCLATHGKPNLEGIGRILIAPAHRAPAVHHHKGQHTQAALFTIRLRHVIRTSMQLKLKSTRRTLRTAGVWNNNCGPLSVGRDRHSHCRIAWHAVPHDIRRILLLVEQLPHRSEEGQ